MVVCLCGSMAACEWLFVELWSVCSQKRGDAYQAALWSLYVNNKLLKAYFKYLHTFRCDYIKTLSKPCFYARY